MLTVFTLCDASQPLRSVAVFRTEDGCNPTRHDERLGKLLLYVYVCRSWHPSLVCECSCFRSLHLIACEQNGMVDGR